MTLKPPLGFLGGAGLFGVTPPLCGSGVSQRLSRSLHSDDFWVYPYLPVAPVTLTFMPWF